MPTMPSLPSRKISKLWAGSSSSKQLPSPEPDLLPTEESHSTNNDPAAKTTLAQASQQRVKQFFTDNDQGGEGLAADINLRRKTNERLYSAVEAYWSSLSESWYQDASKQCRNHLLYHIDKSKPLPFEMSRSSALEIAMTLDEAKTACQSSYPNTSPIVVQAAEEASLSIANGQERVLPIEALGLAMASCANTYARSQKEGREDQLRLEKNGAYASHLSHLSAVHLALAQLQAEYTSSLSSTLLSRLARSQAAIEALRTTEKGTEAARERMEAAEKRRDKAKEKGDKNRRDMEEEARMARATYEEALADLETRTEILRDSEQKGPGSGVAILKEYMDVHLAWVEAQHDIIARARAALDQYPTSQYIPSVNVIAPGKNRAAPPPPPPTQSAARRIVAPPPMLKEEQRKRSVSSSQMLHKPKMTSRSSLNDIVPRSREKEESARRPSSRGADSVKEGSSSRGTTPRIAFNRSESYSAYNTSNDALSGDAFSKNEGKKSRIGDIKATFGRSTSSLGQNASDTTTAKTTPSTTGGTAADFSGSEKSSIWAGNLLSRKIKDAKKGDGAYKVMKGDDQAADRSERQSLSHVQEASAESRSGLEDVLFIQGQPSIVDTTSDSLSGQDNDFHLDTRHQKLWEKFGSRRDSLGINSQLTGNTVSSEGSNPFGHEGGELSPIGTGNGQFPILAREAWPGSAGGNDDPADGLLGDKDDGAIRKTARR